MYRYTVTNKDELKDALIFEFNAIAKKNFHENIDPFNVNLIESTHTGKGSWDSLLNDQRNLTQTKPFFFHTL